MFKFFLLANRNTYQPLQTHLENKHVERKMPYPITVEGEKTLTVSYTVRGFTPSAAA